jgi:four helix bundle protein
VYQKSYALALDVHRVTLSFPKIEQYGLAQQLRNSTKSIPANIVEGMGKQESKRDVTRFLRVALGSCDETRMRLDFAKDLEYIDANKYKELYDGYCEIGRMLRGVMKRFS